MTIHAARTRSDSSSRRRPIIGSLAPGSARAAAGAAALSAIAATSATGPNRSSRIASYSSVVVASGATPSSRSSMDTVVRYWRMAPARSPPRASAAISRCRAGSSSGSSSTSRVAAAIAPAASPPSSAAVTRRSSTSTMRRSTVTARVARQSSKSGLSRSENPARNGPRARAAAAANEDGSAALVPASSAARSSQTPSPCCASATVALSTRSQRSPSAERSTDSVRRSALRADSSSDSGQNSAASSSRAYGRRSTASRATMADALRVSTRIGSPSTWISSGPRTRISSDIARNGTTVARNPVTFRERSIPRFRCHDPGDAAGSSSGPTGRHARLAARARRSCRDARADRGRADSRAGRMGDPPLLGDRRDLGAHGGAPRDPAAGQPRRLGAARRRAWHRAGTPGPAVGVPEHRERGRPAGGRSRSDPGIALQPGILPRHARAAAVPRWPADVPAVGGRRRDPPLLGRGDALRERDQARAARGHAGLRQPARHAGPWRTCTGADRHRRHRGVHLHPGRHPRRGPPVSPRHAGRAQAAQVVRLRAGPCVLDVLRRDVAPAAVRAVGVDRRQRIDRPRPCRHRDRHPAVPPVRDRPDRQPHDRLGARDRAAGGGVRRDDRRPPGAARAVHEQQHPRGRGIHARRRSAVPATPCPGPAGRGPALQPGTRRRPAGDRRVRGPPARRRGPRRAPRAPRRGRGCRRCSPNGAGLWLRSGSEPER